MKEYHYKYKVTAGHSFWKNSRCREHFVILPNKLHCAVLRAPSKHHSAVLRVSSKHHSAVCPGILVESRGSPGSFGGGACIQVHPHLPNMIWSLKWMLNYSSDWRLSVVSLTRRWQDVQVLHFKLLLLLLLHFKLLLLIKIEWAGNFGLVENMPYFYRFLYMYVEFWDQDLGVFLGFQFWPPQPT